MELKNKVVFMIKAKGTYNSFEFHIQTYRLSFILKPKI